MKRPEACNVLEELVACWKERDGSDSELIGLAFQGIGFEFGLFFALNYPEYAVSLRDALNNSDYKGDSSIDKFLRIAADIIAKHPIEAQS